jgi:integrase
MGVNPVTGAPIRRSVYGKTQAEVILKKQSLTASLNEGDYIEPSRMTVSQWIDAWVRDYCESRKSTTMRGYKSAIKNHIKPALGRFKLQNVTSIQVQTFVMALSRNKHLEPHTVRNVHGVLHAMFEKAQKLGYVKKNCADDTELPRLEKKPVRVLRQNETLAFFRATFDQEVYGQVMRFAFHTAVRECEALGMAWNCIDFKNSTVTIRQQLQKSDGGYILATTKSNKSRTFAVPPSVMRQLAEQKARQEQQRKQAGKLWTNPLHLVFTDEFGKNLVPRTLVKHFKKALQQAGIDDTLHFHDLRHTAITNMVASGVNPKTIQAIAGHYSMSFTMDVYATVTPEMYRAAAEELESICEAVECRA